MHQIDTTKDATRKLMAEKTRQNKLIRDSIKGFRVKLYLLHIRPHFLILST